jgi:hypothetical protein
MNGTVAAARPRAGRVRFALGLVVGLVLPVLAGEAYVRIQPPEDLEPYLGDQSSRTGIYRPDPQLRVDYRSIDVYVPKEAPRFADIKLDPSRPVWLFFGNSFAGNLADSVVPALPSHQILFFREPKDEFHMRVAQARLLLENGLRADRMFFTLIPIEFARYVLRPLPWVYVNSHGAIGRRFRMGGWPISDLLTHSWLARVAWIRTKLHHADPTFRMSRITETVPESVLDDFKVMLGVLGDVSRKHGVPATIILLPDRRQILNTSDFVLQAKISELVKAAGLDVLDPRDAFLAYPDKRAMYVPDWHYSAIGDQVLLGALAAHLKQSIPVPQRREAAP